MRAQRCPCETGWLGVHTALRPRWILRNRLLQLAHALNGIGLRVLCVRLEVRSGGCLLLRDASGLALHPGVKGYCRPGLPAHCRGKKPAGVGTDGHGERPEWRVFRPECGFIRLCWGWIFLTGGGMFFTGSGREGGGRLCGVGTAEIAIAGQPAPAVGSGCIRSRRFAARTISCGEQDPTNEVVIR